MRAPLAVLDGTRDLTSSASRLRPGGLGAAERPDSDRASGAVAGGLPRRRAGPERDVVIRDGVAAGHSERTLQRAAERLNVNGPDDQARSASGAFQPRRSREDDPCSAPGATGATEDAALTRENEDLGTDLSCRAHPGHPCHASRPSMTGATPSMPISRVAGTRARPSDKPPCCPARANAKEAAVAIGVPAVVFYAQVLPDLHTVRRGRKQLVPDHPTGNMAGAEHRQNHADLGGYSCPVAGPASRRCTEAMCDPLGGKR